MAQNKSQELAQNKSEIAALLTEEIVKRYYFQNGRTEASFQFDTEIQEALKLFANPQQMQAILAVKK